MAFHNRLPFTFRAHARPLIAVLAIASGSMTAHALTLGRMKVLSGMGEPLRAEVEIASASAEESQSLRAQIAPPRSFQQAGMEYNPALEGLMANIESRPGGNPVIVLQGRKPVQESFIDLILETQSSAGRVTRNYALLLNAVADSAQKTPSPALARTTPSASVTPSAGTSPTPVAETSSPRIEYNAQNVPVYRFDPVETPKTPATQPLTSNPVGTASNPMPTPAVDPASGGITVEPGQTASHLALAHIPSSVSLDQMLAAMLRNNPDAFIAENVNLLRAGALLRMPTAEQAQQISPQEARQIIIAQHRDFAAYAQRIAQSPHRVTKGSDREVEGKVSADVQTEPNGNAARDTLTLSKSRVDKDSSEAKLAAQREAQDEAEQLASLSKNVDELNKLASAKAATASESKLTASSPGGMNWGNELANQSIWMWGAALAGLLGALLWWRNRARPAHDSFAPSYEDEPNIAAEGGQNASAIPPQMANIDLNLGSTPAGAPVTVSPLIKSNDTDVAKLELARVLLSKGDTAIARSLVQSVATNGAGELKVQAQQMLSQFP